MGPPPECGLGKHIRVAPLLTKVLEHAALTVQTRRSSQAYSIIFLYPYSYFVLRLAAKVLAKVHGTGRRGVKTPCRVDIVAFPFLAFNLFVTDFNLHGRARRHQRHLRAISAQDVISLSLC